MKVSRDTIRHWEAQRHAARLARQFDHHNDAARLQELRAWLKQADDNGGIVYIGRIWSVTGLPQSFDTWAAP